MSEVNRRQAITGAALTVGAIGATAALAACSTNSSNGGTTSVISTIITDADNVTLAVGTIVDDLKPIVPAATFTIISNAYGSLQAADKLIDSLSSVSTSGSAVTQFATIFNTLLDAAATIPGLPPSVSTGLAAAAVIVPIIESLAGIKISAVKAAANVKLGTPVIAPASAYVIVNGLAERYRITHNLINPSGSLFKPL